MEKQWYYMNLKDFEMQIRSDERDRIYKRHERVKKQIREKAIKIWNERLYLLRQKIIGVLIIIITILLCRSNFFYEPTIQANDCTFALLTLPIGLVLLLSRKRILGEEK